ncbi:DUF397 domain-containing protein [Streptomyces sp. SID8381]|uniref:DUF397 domain-containing protein n=1 Tax=unclassified Streptomyces TaxID=2593676 RepID=UPI000377D782|nr:MULTISPECIES: DUF397 domain-containing protein [unclassified Streptomyces]MYX26780.1 DUF397 domain-containing protein [Streptomyces sp. SID8381]
MTRKRTHTAPELTAAGAVWRKSSYSDGAGNNCIEAATFPTEIGVRDSKKPEGAALVFPRASWAAFVTAAGTGGLASDARL